jgi:nucleotide-binding universal stress UspA family protein
MKSPGSSIADMHVIVDREGERRPARIAADLAARLDAHLTGIAIAFEPTVPVYAMPAAIPAEMIVAARERAIAEAETTAAAFRAIATAAGVPLDTRTHESLGGEGVAGIAGALALSDLVVVGQVDPDRPDPLRRVLIESILFHARAPALLIPYTGVTGFRTGRAMVAWDGGGTAAAAVRAAMPLLTMADEVLAVIVAEAGKSEMPGADIGAYLARHGLKVQARAMDVAGGSVASALLNFAADEGADWLVMGAYGHSRLREFLLGGTTREILASMTLPVLMAH